MAVDYPFAIVPLDLMKQVSASAVCVYAVLAEAANRDQQAWPSKATIADRTGLSSRTVQRAIAELRDSGWIRVSERHRENGSTTSNTYFVRRVRGDMGVLPPQDIRVSPPHANLSPPEQDPIEPDPMFELNITERQQVDDPFDEWWKQYPRKVQKQAARRAYKKAAAKVGHERLLEAMLRYRDEDDRVAKGFIQHASTWLNGECWDDETVTSPQSDEERQWAALRAAMGDDTGEDL